MKKVMVFGVFDGLHEGHRAFLAQAKTLSDDLVIVLASDSIVQAMKGHAPKFTFAQRKIIMETEFPRAEVVAGDSVLGAWSVLRDHTPNIIVLGYDQRELARALQALLPTLRQKLAIMVLQPYQPEHYKSSILNGKE